MLRKIQRPAGFSLVELVIVIVILGIIAAVAVPRITSGSRNAAESALRADLRTLRDAIDWYYVEHHNSFPGAKSNGVGPNAASPEAMITQLTKPTNAQGWIVGDPASLPFGPYLRNHLPKLTVGPNAGRSDVTVVNQAAAAAVDAGAGTAWIYNVATGQIIANASEVGSDGITYDAY